METNFDIGVIDVKLEKYQKPMVTSKVSMKDGLIPAAITVAGLAKAASAVAFAVAVSGDDDFHPEHMQSLTSRKKINV